MKNERKEIKILKMDYYEQRILATALNELRNTLIKEGRYTDCVDELLLKVIDAPGKKEKIYEYSY